MRPRLHPALTFSLLLFTVAAAAADDHDDRIRRIERRLMPPVLVEGLPDSGWSVTDRMRHHRVRGLSVAVVESGTVVWARGYGVIDTVTRAPVTPRTRFQAASVSKPVAALVALRMVERGQLTLDANVQGALRRWRIPESRFLAERPVTLRGLLTHSAGLTVHGFPGYRHGDSVPTLVQVLEGAAPANTPAIVADTIPGHLNRYSGGGFQVAQLLMEDVSGTDFVSLAQLEILGPLGMARSTFAPLAEAGPDLDVARGHDADGRRVAGGWHDYPEQAAAALWTTPTDLARVIVMLQRVHSGDSAGPLRPETVREMMRLQPPGNEQGLGLALKSRDGRIFRFSHNGSNEGFRALWLGTLDTGKGVVAMANGDDAGDLLMEYARAVASAYGYSDLQPQRRQLVHASARDRESLVGEYQIEGVRWRLVIREGPEGELTAGPAGRRPMKLLAAPGDIWFFPEIADVWIETTRRPDGRVDAIRWRQGDRAAAGQRVGP